MKEIFNNLAFRSTLVCLSITKKHFWLCSQTQRTKKILFVSETQLSLKVEFVLQSAPFSSSSHFFFTLYSCRASSTSISFFAVSFLYFSEYLIKLIFSFEVLES